MSRAKRGTLSPGVPFPLRSAADFEGHLTGTGDRWVIVEFGAQWAAACAAMKVVFDDLARENPTAIFLRADIEQNPEVAQRYGILRVPSYCFFFCGEKEVEFAGCSERKLRETVANCMELGPQVSWRALGGSKQEALVRSREEAYRRAADLAQQSGERRLQERVEEEGKRQKERDAEAEAHRAFADLTARWQENRWTEEDDRRKEEADLVKQMEEEQAARRRREEEEREKEERVNARSLEQAQKMISELQQRQEEERHAKVHFQREAQGDLDRKAREIEELKASLDDARQAKANAELVHHQMHQETSKRFEQQFVAQEQRAKEEAAKLAAEKARLEQEAEEARQSAERLQRIHTAEARGHVKFDTAQLRVNFLSEIKFKSRYYGTDRKDDPTAEFVDNQLVQALFGDLGEILAVHEGYAVELVRTVKLPTDISSIHDQKEKWTKALQQGRINLLTDHLVQAGAPEDCDRRLVYGAFEETYVQLKPPRFDDGLR